MENVAQFVSYLDYGVLGLSAIILILSFVLLSREQKRDVFRPEVEKAIRRYMMLALAFAAIGLVSTVLEGVFVKPAKQEKQEIENQMDILSGMVAKRVEANMNISENPILTEDIVVPPLPITPETISDNVGNRNGDSINVDIPVIPDSIIEYNKLKKSVFLSIYDFSANKELFEKAVNKLAKENKDVAHHKNKIINDYDEIADMKIEWLEQEAIPAMEQATKSLSKEEQKSKRLIIDLPTSLVVPTDKTNKTIVSDLDAMKKELNLLKNKKTKDK